MTTDKSPKRLVAVVEENVSIAEFWADPVHEQEPTTDKSSEREAFEAWSISVGMTRRDRFDDNAWAAWQARAALPQQAQEAPSDDLRELGKWLNEEPNRPIDRSALARVVAWAQVSAPQQAQEALDAESVARWLADHDLLEEAERVRAAIAKGEQP